jgi:hypothetical protein
VYNDALVPAVDSKQESGQSQNSEPIDPVERVKQDRQNWEAIAVSPIVTIQSTLVQKLIDQGADPSYAQEFVNSVIAPELQKQQALVEGHYQESFENALQEKVTNPFTSKLSEYEQKEQQAASMNNIDQLSKQYYADGGKDAFFALINGYNDSSGKWVRGEAAHVVDMLVSASIGDKKFKSDAERSSTYADTFRKFTADPAKARALIDTAHYYYLGKNIDKAKQLAFKQGQQAVQQQQKLVQRTVRSKPASYSANQDSLEIPEILRMAGAR